MDSLARDFFGFFYIVFLQILNLWTKPVRDHSNEIFSLGGFSIVESEIHDCGFVSVLYFDRILRAKL